MRSAEPLAADLLRSCLAGLERLFERAAMGHWQQRVRLVLDLGDPEAMAAAYRLMSQGSAPGTFYDLIISERNRHAIGEQQEAWVNELLTTFQAIAAAAADAIAHGGANASLPVTPSEAALPHPVLRGAAPDVPDRSHVIVYEIDCETCGSRFLWDEAVASAAARRWALQIAPTLIGAQRSAELVATAFEPGHDPEAQRALDHIRPAAEKLGLPAIRLPYNRPAGQPDDRCSVCGADTWTPIPLRLVDEPLGFVPVVP